MRKKRLDRALHNQITSIEGGPGGGGGIKINNSSETKTVDDDQTLAFDIYKLGGGRCCLLAARPSGTGTGRQRGNLLCAGLGLAVVCCAVCVMDGRLAGRGMEGC